MGTVFVMNNAGLSCVGDENAKIVTSDPNVVLLKFGERVPPSGSVIVYRTNEAGGWFGVRRSGREGRILRRRCFRAAISAASRLAS